MAIEKQALGAAIKQVRMARGFTQIELAKAAGLSKGGKSIALVEQGKRFVSVDTLNALAGALDIPSACLAILGSKTIGKNKAATELMKSLQNLVSTVVAAEAELRTKENATRISQPSKKKSAKILNLPSRATATRFRARGKVAG